MPAEVGPITTTGTEDDGWRWYSVEQAAALLGISTPTVRRRIREGGPPFTLRDGSSVPVTAESLTRPQGSYFQVKLPASLEGHSTEDPVVEDAPVDPSPTEQQASASDHDVSVTDGRSDQHASDALAALVPMVERLAAQLTEKGEMLGELRATVAHVTAERDASRDETTRVRADLDSTQAELAETRAGLIRETVRRAEAEAVLEATRDLARPEVVPMAPVAPEATSEASRGLWGWRRLLWGWH